MTAAMPPCKDSPLSPKGRASVAEIVFSTQTVGTLCMAKKIGKGVIRFVGPTQFAAGSWIGVELLAVDAVGKNDGSVLGVKYFDCPPNKGIFCRPSAVDAIFNDEPARSGSKDLLEPEPVSATGTTFKRRRSVDGLLSGSIVVKGQNDMTQAVGAACGEILKLEKLAGRLSKSLESALAREAAAKSALAQKNTDVPAVLAAAGVPTGTDLEMEAWLDKTTGRMQSKVEQRIQETLQDQMAEALREPLKQLVAAAQEVRRIKPGTTARRHSIS